MRMRTGPGGPNLERLHTGGQLSEQPADVGVRGSGTSPPGVRARVGVVLAAGRSERLSKLTNGRSKALTQLGGVPLVERAVRTLLAAGMERVVVVVGYQGGDVASAARLAPGDVEIVRAENWEAGNGQSLAAAEQALEGEELFVLLCGDHAFADGALEPLVEPGRPAVLVDPAPPREAWAEGTRVHVRGARALAFSKDIDEPVIDCGVFVLPQSVFEAQRSAAGEGDHSLAGAVTRVARETPVRAVPLGRGSWWQDIDTPEDLRAAKTLVRRSLGKESDGLISRYLNRPISTRITMALSPLRLAPNLISLFTLAVGFWAAWSVSAGRAVVGAILTQTASMLDGVDGETARLHNRGSPRGAFVDGLCDRMVDAAVVAGLWLWFWDDPGRIFRIVMILASVIGWTLIALAAKETVSVLDFGDDQRPPLSVLVGGRDARMFLLAVVFLFNQPLAAFFIFVALYLGSGARRLVLFRTRRRRPPPEAPPPDQVGDTPQRDLREIG